MTLQEKEILYTSLQQEEAGFEKEWLTLEKYNFKLLTLVSVLAQNHLAYRGTVADMCQYLGVANQTKNRRMITEAIVYLEEKGMVKTLVDGKIYTITLSVKAEKKKDVIVIQKKWIEMVQGLKSKGVTWDNVLRVWLYLIANEEEIITSKKIAEDLHMDEKMIKRVKGVLVNDLKAIKTRNRAQKVPTGFRMLGQTIDVFAWVD